MGGAGGELVVWEGVVWGWGGEGRRAVGVGFGEVGWSGVRWGGGVLVGRTFCGPTDLHTFHRLEGPYPGCTRNRCCGTRFRWSRPHLDLW